MPNLAVLAGRRRRRRTGSGAPADIATLVAALGGNASVPALYDVRAGITASTTVSQWDDARGAVGFGPSLVQATASKRPAWNGTSLLITGDGVDDSLSCLADTAAFNPSTAITVVYIGTATGGAGNTYLVSMSNAGFTSALAVRKSVADLAVAVGGASLAAEAGTDAVATRRLLIGTKNATTTASVQVPSLAAVSAGISAQTSISARLTLFDYYDAGGSNAAGACRAVLVLARQATAGDVSTLLAWAQTYHAAVAA